MDATNERDCNGSNRNNFLFVRGDVHTTTICKLGVVTKFMLQANSVTLELVLYSVYSKQLVGYICRKETITLFNKPKTFLNRTINVSKYINIVGC
jgi:hypothetical protein